MNGIILILYLLSFLVIWQFVGYPILMAIISCMKKLDEKDYSYQPFVSIIVPTYNEEKVIKRRIENLLYLNYQKDKYEVIVVDSGSKDRTVELVDNIIKQYPNPPLKLIREKERKGKASAINLSKNHAKGNIVLITDANSLFDKNVLREMMPHFKNPGVGAVSGRYHVSNPNKTLTRSEMFYWEIEDIIMKGESSLDSISTVIGTISAWRKDLMNFNSLTISEDLDMTIQLRRRGYQIKYEPLAFVYEPAATTEEDQIKQRKRTSTGTIQNIFKHFYFFLFPRNFYTFLVFPSHKTLTMISPFILLGIPIMYVFVWDIEIIIMHFILTVLIFAGLLFLLLYLKTKLNKTEMEQRRKSVVSLPMIIYYVMLNEYTIILAWYDFIFNKYSVLWERAESTREGGLAKVALKNPFVSIIVGIRNEEKYIGECIISLLDLDYPKNSYEIIIVDGMSSDNTQNIIKQYPVKLILNEKINVAAARNLGVKSAKGDFIAFTDGDCKVDKFWLRTLVDGFMAAPEEVMCVGGHNLVFDTDPVFARVVGYAQETLMGSGGSAQSHGYTKKQYVQSIANCNAFYKKSAIEDVGYFDEYFVLGQDADLNHRMQKAGFKFWYLPEAKVWHHRRASIKSFSIRMFKYGAWMAELFRKHGELIRWYALIPPFAIIISLIAVVSLAQFPIIAKIIEVLVIAYIILISFTALQVTYKMKSSYGLLAYLILPLQHSMYGFGVLSIVAKYIKRI